MKRFAKQLLICLTALLFCPGWVAARERSPFVVEGIEILGNARTKDNVIIRSMVLKQGDLLTSKRIIATQRDLYRTRLFRTVHVSSKPGTSDGKAIVVVYVEEKRFGDVNLGGEYSELDGFTFVSEVRYVNLQGDGKSIGVSYDLGERRKGWKGAYSDPYLFNSRYSFLLGLHGSTFERDLYPDTEVAFRKAQRLGTSIDPSLGNPDRNGIYKLDRLGATLGFSRDFGKGYRTIFKYGAEEVDVGWFRTPKATGPFAKEIGNNLGRDALVTLGLEFRKGLVGPVRRLPQTEFTLSAEYSPVLLGSAARFARLRADAAAHIPLVPGHILSFEFKSGAVLWDPPFYERLFLDGNYQLKGFERRAIGPEGGTKMLFVEAVYSLPVGRLGRFYLFGEAANVWVKGQEIKLRELDGTFGVGLSLLNRIEFSFGFGPRTFILRTHRIGGIRAGL